MHADRGADLVVEGGRIRHRQKRDSYIVAKLVAALLEQPAADAAALEVVVHREIAAIGDPGEIGEATGEPDAAPIEPRGDDEVGAADHRRKARRVLERARDAER